MMERWSQLHVLNIAVVSYTGGRITLKRRQHNPVHRGVAVARTASPFKLLNASDALLVPASAAIPATAT
jgi:hypothetical protein